jgi:hypothetical protein
MRADQEMKERGKGCWIWMVGLALAVLVCARAGAQEQSRPFSANGQEAPAAQENAPPPMPVEEIIRKFAQREDEMKRERDQFTYQQTWIMQTVDADGNVDGEQRESDDIVFNVQGKRYEKVTDAPATTLTRIMLTQQDIDDLEHIQPFVLTSDKIAQYDVKYVGREHLDELDTYVFDVGPKKIEKNQRYFQGRIWVDARDLEIVKTYGKAVPDIIKHGTENIFPRFETIRENIEGNYWFPTYTHADDYLHFTGQNVHIRMTVRYKNYKRFGTTIKFGTPTEVKPEKPDKP